MTSVALFTKLRMYRLRKQPQYRWPAEVLFQVEELFPDDFVALRAMDVFLTYSRLIPPR